MPQPVPEPELKASQNETPEPTLEAKPSQTQPAAEAKTSQSKPAAAKPDHNPSGRRRTLADLATVVSVRDDGLHKGVQIRCTKVLSVSARTYARTQTHQKSVRFFISRLVARSRTHASLFLPSSPPPTPAPDSKFSSSPSHRFLSVAHTQSHAHVISLSPPPPSLLLPFPQHFVSAISLTIQNQVGFTRILLSAPRYD